ncbi:hypothetical protein [Novosphingobium sp.]|nr:hypothetical protein [Novosphingobium sp.]
MGEHDHRMRKRGKIVLIGFLLVASFFLLTEYTVSGQNPPHSHDFAIW